MMKKSVLVVAVGIALTAATFAASSVSKKPVTVGDFAVKVSAAIGHPVATPEAAVQSLRSLGVKVGDANGSLTEGTAARMLQDLGVRVSTSSPDKDVTVAKADQMAVLASITHAASSTIPESTPLPTQCLELRNRGQCDNCCTTYLTSVGADTSNGVCAHFCRQVPPPGQASPSDPQP